MVRVRFAPSPTGHLHVGAARTALFNWLFAHHHQGRFILRIEDTDVARSSEEMSRGIMAGLEWLNLLWDEGPIFQSQRLDIYKQYARQLVDQGKAYYCYCLPREIERRREAAARTKAWKYDRRCLSLPFREKERFEQEGRPRAIRFLVPDGVAEYEDLVHGPIAVETKHIEDFVLLRSDGFPTYHLSVVVDDLQAGITHVIRGDDHISNTPKQILLYQAFEKPLPRFAHLALILGPDRKKLSKRHGVTSLLHFKEKGYLALAMFNFLAQMSWSPGPEERIYSVEEMIREFSLEKLSKGSPIFDMAKLDWLNSRLISAMTAEELFPHLEETLRNAGLWRESLTLESKPWFLRLIDLLKVRSRTIQELADSARPFLSDDFPLDPAGREKHLSDAGLRVLLSKLREDFIKIEDFSAANIEEALRGRSEAEGVKAALFIHALRLLAVGKTVSPGIFDVLALLGKGKTLERITYFLEENK